MPTINLPPKAKLFFKVTKLISLYKLSKLSHFCDDVFVLREVVHCKQLDIGPITLFQRCSCVPFQYVLNVTPDLPNTFESAGGISYLKIPIADHWSQNLAVHFPQAIRFIGKRFCANTSPRFSGLIRLKRRRG